MMGRSQAPLAAMATATMGYRSARGNRMSNPIIRLSRKY
jgi:hypothetical protein